MEHCGKLRPSRFSPLYLSCMFRRCPVTVLMLNGKLQPHSYNHRFDRKLTPYSLFSITIKRLFKNKETVRQVEVCMLCFVCEWKSKPRCCHKPFLTTNIMLKVSLFINFYVFFSHYLVMFDMQNKKTEKNVVIYSITS